MRKVNKLLACILVLAMYLSMATVAHAAVLSNTASSWNSSYYCVSCGRRLSLDFDEQTSWGHQRGWVCTNSACDYYINGTGGVSQNQRLQYTINGPHQYDGSGTCFCGYYDSSQASCSHSSYHYSYTQYNASSHYCIQTCTSCGEQLNTWTESHSLSGSYSYLNASYHTYSSYCSKCGYSSSSGQQPHTWSSSYSQYNDQQHRVDQVCTGCGHSTTTYAAHTDSNGDGRCDSCGYSMSVTVTWNASANGGTINGQSSVTTSVTSGSVASAPSYTPAKTGHTFKGWYTAASGGSLYSSVSVTSARTFYAQFTPATYTITWNLGDGRTETTSQAYGEKLTLPATPTRAGYTFTGWYTASTGGSQVTASTTYTTAEATTYYARWTAKSYTITWNLGDGKTETTQQTYGAKLVLPEEPSRSGYSFAGWYTSSTGGTQVTSSTTYTTAGASTYYARWTKVQAFSVTVPAVLPLAMGEDGRVHTSEAGIINHSTGAVRVSSITAATKNGWKLVSWNTDMAQEKVDTHLIGFTLNGAETKGGAGSESLPLTGDWTIPQDGSLPLSYDAVISALSQPVTDQTILSVVFVLEWA